MIYDLVPSSAEILSTKLEPFDFANPPIDSIQLAKDLFETMLHNKAMGLSANQVGLPYRVLAIAANPGIVAFNPRIVDQTTEEIYLDEACATYPGMALKVKRPKMVKIRYFEPNGNTVTQKFIGLTARIILHEIDHLNGINFTQRANKAHLDRALRQQKALVRQRKNLK